MGHFGDRALGRGTGGGRLSWNSDRESFEAAPLRVCTGTAVGAPCGEERLDSALRTGGSSGGPGPQPRSRRASVHGNAVREHQWGRGFWPAAGQVTSPHGWGTLGLGSLGCAEGEDLTPCRGSQLT